MKEGSCSTGDVGELVTSASGVSSFLSLVCVSESFSFLLQPTVKCLSPGRHLASWLPGGGWRQRASLTKGGGMGTQPATPEVLAKITWLLSTVLDM